jgi:ATP-dependent helicase/nuclease subunit B
MAGKADGSTLSLFGPGRIFSIPASAPFLDTLAGSLLRGDLTSGRAPEPAELAGMRIYLPDRAACRALEAALLRVLEGGTPSLPRIMPIDGVAGDALSILHKPETKEPAPDAPVPQPINALERRMVLTRLILAWADRVKRGMAGEAGALALTIAETPTAASELALGLMRLMDEADTQQVDLGRLRTLLPERFAAHEQLSLDFLNIVLDAWPAYLEASGRLPSMARRNRVLTLEAKAIAELRSDQPVIVAGSVGADPATEALIGAVYAHRSGAIVLPGVDLVLDDGAWRALADHPEHPQAAIARLIARLGAARADITPLSADAPGSSMAARARFFGEAMRPSGTIAAWPAYIEKTRPEAVRRALGGVSLIAAPTEHEEAAAIAVILREAAETPGRSASLITPDRGLARRVRAQLGKWGLQLTDEAGTPLAAMAPGVFHQLVADVAASGARIAMLALLKHPLTRLGLPPGGLDAAASTIEMAALRQPWSTDGVAQLAPGLTIARHHHRKHQALGRLNDAEWDAAEAVAARFADALQPLIALAQRKPAPLRELAQAHLAAAHRLAADEIGEVPHYGNGGDEIAAFMAALTRDSPGPSIKLKDYPALFRSLMSLEVQQDGAASRARLRILGPREARLGFADTVIVAGLNEGIWPEMGEASPWLNGAMRRALGLPATERQTALSAHDFAQAMHAPELILTRAMKAEGTPTVPSRWLLRIEALLGGMGLKDALAPKRPWLQWALAGEAAEARWRAKPPAPCPPVEVRPRQLSVSEIATLMVNPYAIHARHILGLRPLGALEAEPGGAERGRVIHDTLHAFAKRYPQELPADTARELVAIFDAQIARYGDHTRIAAFWRPRMERFARWFGETEPERRVGVAQVFAQTAGEMIINTAGGPFTMRVSADRIDLRTDGSLAIYDYKGGNLPNETEVVTFKVPNLPLQALIAIDGHFRGIESHEVARLAYISAKGGEPPGEERGITRDSPATLATKAREGLEALLQRFDDAATPYAAMRRGGARRLFDDYAHLARVDEWSGSGD